MNTLMTVLVAVENGFCHSMSAEALFEAGMYEDAKTLVALGYLKRLGPKGRFEDRFVVTGSGSKKLGSFDSDHFEYPNRKAAA